MKKILLCLVFLLGCDKGSVDFFPHAGDEVNKIRYFKDSRTNLCFALSTFTGGGALPQNESVFSNVPCTPEVEKLIK